MRGFRASRAVRNFTSAKFGRNENYGHQSSFQQPQTHGNTQKPQSLPAWLQLANTDVYTKAETPAPVTHSHSTPTKVRHLTLVPSPVAQPQKAMKLKKKLAAKAEIKKPARAKKALVRKIKTKSKKAA
jgi:hypothetical protein